MTTEKDEVKATTPDEQAQNNKMPWTTPEAKDYDPSTLTQSGFTGFGADNGFYS